MITPWVRFTPERAMNRKLRAAGFAARGLDEAACCQVAADDSDGFISEDTVEVLAVAHREKQWRKLAKQLVDVNRWEVAQQHGVDGWLIHDYEEYNQTKAYWEAQRGKKSAAGSKGGKARAAASAQARVTAPAETHALSPLATDAQAATLRVATASPAPAGPGEAASLIGGEPHDAIAEPQAAAGRPPVDNHVPDILDVTAELVAERRMARRRGINDPAAYLRSTTPKIRAEIRPDVEAALQKRPPEGGWTPTTIADFIEAPVKTGTAIPPSYDDQAPLKCADPECDDGWLNVHNDDPVAPCRTCRPELAKAG